MLKEVTTPPAFSLHRSSVVSLSLKNTEKVIQEAPRVIPKFLHFKNNFIRNTSASLFAKTNWNKRFTAHGNSFAMHPNREVVLP